MKVILFRGGAPDKINIWSGGYYQLLRVDHKNLMDVSDSELDNIKIQDDTYLLPADEADIKKSNEWFLNGDLINQSMILLPQIKDQNKVITYEDFVPKDSSVYRSINDTVVQYPDFTTYSIEHLDVNDLKDIIEFNTNYSKEFALKTTTGSGSRGVLLYSPSNIDLGGKYRDKKFTDKELSNFLEFAKKENCNIMIQELIPIRSKSVYKVNVDLIIRNGRLLGYKWTKTDPKSVFTNWDFGWFVRNSYTDMIVEEVTKHLVVTHGIYNAIMNFEAFSDMRTTTWLVEFNWRYSNSMFEGQALSIDLIGQYLTNKEFEVPKGVFKFSRYWQCKLYDDLSIQDALR